MKVVRLSALCIRCLYSSGDIPATHFCWRLCRPQDHSASRRIKSMINTVESKTVLLCISFCALCLINISLSLSLCCTDHRSVCLLPHCSVSALHNTTNFPHILAFTNHGFSNLVAGQRVLYYYTVLLKGQEEKNNSWFPAEICIFLTTDSSNHSVKTYRT